MWDFRKSIFVNNYYQWWRKLRTHRNCVDIGYTAYTYIYIYYFGTVKNIFILPED